MATEFVFAEELLGFRYYSPLNIESGLGLLDGKGKPLVNLKVQESESRTAERIVAAFTNGGVLGMSVLHAANVQHFIDFAYAAAKAPELLGSTVISIGFGGSIHGGIPLRAPAYACPAFHVMRNLQRLNVPVPRLRLFSGQCAAEAVNGYDLNVMWPKTLKLFAINMLYAKRFFPEIANNVFFDFDASPAQRSDVAELVRQLRKEKNKRAGLEDVLNFLASRGKIYGDKMGEEGAMLYIALHPLIFGDWLTDVTGWLRCFTEKTFPPFRISFGGPAERFFNIGRLALCDMRKVQSPGNLMFLIGNGERPVYYMLPDESAFSSEEASKILQGGDSFSEWLRFQRNGTIAEDFRVLAGDRAEVFAYVSFVQEIAEFFGLAAAEGDAAEELLSVLILSPQCPKEWERIIDWLFVAIERISPMPEEQRFRLVRQARELLQNHQSLDALIHEILS